MKLFSDLSSTDYNIRRFSYKETYKFKIIHCESSDLINQVNHKNIEMFNYVDADKDHFTSETCIPSFKASNNENFGITFEPFISLYSATPAKKKNKLIKFQTKNLNLKCKKTQYNIGRWTEDEHRRFIEAILKFGNEWKSVQRHIKTRSSTQSRSHSQKFFLKIKNYKIFDFKDKKPCISSLNELAKTLSEKERENMVELLISYEYNESSEKIEPYSSKKKIYDLSLDFENDEEVANLQFSASSASASALNHNPNQIPRKSNNIILVQDNKENQDEFKDHFLNAFISNKRKHSFEDNLLMLYSFENRRNSIKPAAKRRISEDNFVDSLIQFKMDIL